MAAAHASASLYLCETRCFSSSPSPFRSKSSIETHKFSAFKKPILRKQFASSTFPCSSNPIICKNNTRGNCRFPFVYASLPNQEPALLQVSDGDEILSNEPGTSETKAVKPPASLMLLLSAYREGILQGDENIISETEAMAFMIEKEKNQLVEKISALSSEIKSGKDKYLRLQADFDNFRKRLEKERLTIRGDAKMEVIKSLLPMVDSFERAKQQIKLETDQEKKIDASYQGIYKQFVEILRSLRVAAVPTIGKPFDPALHEAIARVESQELKEGIIIQELRRGFLLEDRLVRPALVKVSSGPGKRQPTSAAKKSAEQQSATARIDER